MTAEHKHKKNPPRAGIPRHPELRLVKSLRNAVRAGHPWLFNSAFAKYPDLPPGACVRVVDERGFLCLGIYEPDHPIAVRVWSLDEEDEPSVASVALRLHAACELRQRVISRDVEAYRLLHGEADACPGWAVDCYRDILVLRTDGEAAAARIPQFLQAVSEVPALRAMRSIIHRRSRGDDGPVFQVLQGEEPQPVTCREYRWLMEADVLHGQKTGWFVDQRENRRLIHDISHDLHVANLFSYTGGFSLAAALGGARSVTSVDISASAMEAARRNFTLNNLDMSRHHFEAVDAFDWFEKARNSDRDYDLLIIDPPSFAPNQRSLENAKKAYGRLFHLGAQKLCAGGLLAASSCSSHVDPAMFRDIVSEATRKAGRRMRILADRGAGPDHPELPAFPEGRYLKFLLCELS